MSAGTRASKLGERESGTGHLQEAVASYDDALKELVREHLRSVGADPVTKLRKTSNNRHQITAAMLVKQDAVGRRGDRGSTSFLTSERVVILVCTTNMRAYPMAQAMRQLVEIAAAASAGQTASVPAQLEQSPAPPR
jgi:hypothetical protein